MSDTKTLQEATDSRQSWLDGRMPLRDEHLCMKGLEYFIEWVEAGMPRKDQ